MLGKAPFLVGLIRRVESCSSSHPLGRRWQESPSETSGTSAPASSNCMNLLSTSTSLRSAWPWTFQEQPPSGVSRHGRPSVFARSTDGWTRAVLEARTASCVCSQHGRLTKSCCQQATKGLPPPTGSAPLYLPCLLGSSHGCSRVFQKSLTAHTSRLTARTAV